LEERGNPAPIELDFFFFALYDVLFLLFRSFQLVEPDLSYTVSGESARFFVKSSGSSEYKIFWARMAPGL